LPSDRSEQASARTTPALLGLFSLVTLPADQRLSRSPVTIRLAAWSRQDHLTFADALALVRRGLSADPTDTMKVPRVFLDRLTDVLCSAA
jgi:hypothetical protein